MTQLQHANPTPKGRSYHGGTMWRYEDARGVGHLGHFDGFSDCGGTDVTYYFRDCGTGELTCARGQLLTHARAVSDCCAERAHLLQAHRGN